MSRRSKRTTSTTEKVVTIVTLACIVLATVLAVCECCKIAYAGFELAMYNVSTQTYNQEQGRSEVLDAIQKEKNEKRQAIYNSDDFVIRTFSNLPLAPKVVIWLMSIFTIPLIPIVEIGYVVYVRTPTKRGKKS